MVVAAWLVPWDWVPGGELAPMPASELFTSAEVRRAEEFSRLRRLLGWSSYAVSLAVALLLGLTPLGARLVRRVAGGLRWLLAVPVGVLALLVLGRLATLPFALAIRAQNLDYGLTRQSLAGWFADQGRSLLVAVVTTSLALLVLVWLARRRPRRWYLDGAGAVVALTFAGSFLYPLLVEPLFNRFTPLGEGTFKASVLRLAEREGVPVDDVLVADASRRTTTLNAYVSGLGSTRRVVVYDTLLDGLTPAQARSVDRARARAREAAGRPPRHVPRRARRRRSAWALLALLLDSDRLRRRAGAGGPADPAVAALVLAAVAVGGLASESGLQRRQPCRRGPSRPGRAGDDAGRRGLRGGCSGGSRSRSLRDPTPAGMEPAVVRQPPDGAAAAGLPGLVGAGRPVSRVLFVTNDFPTRRGGIESFVLALCERLPADEVVVYTASMPAGPRVRRDAAVPGVPRPGRHPAARPRRSRGA